MEMAATAHLTLAGPDNEKLDPHQAAPGATTLIAAFETYDSFLIDLVKTCVADKTLRRPHSLAHAGAAMRPLPL
jgi:hypothetical protein